MRSKIGFIPNGTLLLKKPDEHFEIKDFVKALDNWSKSIKDNPVKDFTAKIEIKQIHTFPVYFVYSQRKYENRSLSEGREYANPRQYPRVPGVSWKTVDAWNYEIAEKDNDQSIILQDTIYADDCNRCDATGTVECACTSCSGRGYTVENEYVNGNRYEKRNSCYSCGGDGRKQQECGNCKGHGGFVNYVICNVAYTNPIWGTKYSDERPNLVNDALEWTADDFNYFTEVKSVKDYVNFVSGDIKQAAIADIISFVNSNDSKNERFLREKTVYGQTFASFVHFSYEEGGEYTIVTYGEKDRVYAPDSPISNCVDNLLSEAEQCLASKDLESTSKILKHVYSMNQKTDIADSFVMNFFKQAGLVLVKLSHDKKYPEEKQIEMRHVAKGFNIPVDKKDLFSFSNEILGYLVVPFMAALAYGAYKTDLKSATFMTDFIYTGVKILFASVCSMGIQYYFNREKDLYYKQTWKYLTHGLIFSAAPIYLASTGNGLFESIIGGAIMGLAQWVGTAIFKKYLDDTKNFFQLKSRPNDISDFCQEFKAELADIKSELPKNHSYIDVDSQNAYVAQARYLEEISTACSNDEEISYFSDSKKEAS